MPRLNLMFKGYIFFFYSNEGTPLEPCHIHVRKNENVAKFWIEPNVSLASSYGIPLKDLTSIKKFIIKNKTTILEKWNDYFSS
jgi:hypothetical protein